MRISILAGVLALALSSSAAFAADFTGPRAEVRVGYDNFDGVEDVNYGIGVGYDVAVAPGLTVGALAGVDFSGIDGVGREVELGGRVGVKLTDNVLAFGKVAYTNTRFLSAFNEDGFKVGAGVEVALGRSLYTSLAYDHTDYGQGLNRDAVKLGLGYRF